MHKSVFVLLLTVAFSSQRAAAQDPTPSACHCNNVIEGICTTTAQSSVCNDACERRGMSPGFCIVQQASAHNDNAATCVCSGNGPGLVDCATSSTSSSSTTSTTTTPTTTESTATPTTTESTTTPSTTESTTTPTTTESTTTPTTTESTTTSSITESPTTPSVITTTTHRLSTTPRQSQCARVIRGVCNGIDLPNQDACKHACQDAGIQLGVCVAFDASHLMGLGVHVCVCIG